ncbi:MAG: hypothetical protein HQL25_05965 [Candidatus Omnitrophica bacterium]|nr:hypothetical protein [Candidatus Omnitrophota bacterium]
MKFKNIISFILVFLMILPNTGWTQSTLLFSTGSPLILKGMIFDPSRSSHIDFVFDSDVKQPITYAEKQNIQISARYFLSALTTPDKDLWVNLSPKEPDRIIPVLFGKTDMGRDMLKSDYKLKQLTSQLLDPRDPTGRTFWNEVRDLQKSLYSQKDFSTEMWSKVWIIPGKVDVRVAGNKVFIIKADLKVEMRSDENAQKSVISDPRVVSIFQKCILPVIEDRINNDQNFSELRQIFRALILSAWFKRNQPNHILNRTYANKRAVYGIDRVKTGEIKNIYNRYLRAVLGDDRALIQEEYDPITQSLVAKKIVTGGVIGKIEDIHVDQAASIKLQNPFIAGFDLAMLGAASSHSKSPTMIMTKEAFSYWATDKFMEVLKPFEKYMKDYDKFLVNPFFSVREFVFGSVLANTYDSVHEQLLRELNKEKAQRHPFTPKISVSMIRLGPEVWVGEVTDNGVGFNEHMILSAMEKPVVSRKSKFDSGTFGGHGRGIREAVEFYLKTGGKDNLIAPVRFEIETRNEQGFSIKKIVEVGNNVVTVKYDRDFRRAEVGTTIRMTYNFKEADQQHSAPLTYQSTWTPLIIPDSAQITEQLPLFKRLDKRDFTIWRLQTYSPIVALAQEYSSDSIKKILGSFRAALNEPLLPNAFDAVWMRSEKFPNDNFAADINYQVRYDSKGFLELSVTSNGVGIDKFTFAKLFNGPIVSAHKVRILGKYPSYPIYGASGVGLNFLKADIKKLGYPSKIIISTRKQSGFAGVKSLDVLSGDVEYLNYKGDLPIGVTVKIQIEVPEYARHELVPGELYSDHWSDEDEGKTENSEIPGGIDFNPNQIVLPHQPDSLDNGQLNAIPTGLKGLYPMLKSMKFVQPQQIFSLPISK